MRAFTKERSCKNKIPLTCLRNVTVIVPSFHTKRSPLTTEPIETKQLLIASNCSYADVAGFSEQDECRLLSGCTEIVLQHSVRISSRALMFLQGHPPVVVQQSIVYFPQSDFSYAKKDSGFRQQKTSPSAPKSDAHL